MIVICNVMQKAAKATNGQPNFKHSLANDSNLFGFFGFKFAK